MRRDQVATLVRFAGVGVVNTGIDTGLFLVLHGALGLFVANVISSTAGMAFSFVVNGLFTFRSERLTLRHALTFVATTGVVLWALQPLVIVGLVALEHPVTSSSGTLVYLVAKLGAIAVSLVLNFAAYRFVVWPAPVDAEVDEPDATPVPLP